MQTEFSLTPNKKVSVITVCRNSELTIERCLRSVILQNWPLVEHIIIDGASSDNTIEIVNRYRDHISCLISEPDCGIYDAMNKGLRLATGDIVCFLNSDDYYATNEVLSFVANNMSQFRLDAVMGDVGFFKSKNPTRIIRRYRSNHFSPSRLALGWMPAHPALFLDSNVIKRVGSFNTSYDIAGDFEFIIRAFHSQNLSYLHVPKILVNMQVGGISTNGLLSKIKLNKEVLRACRENKISTNIFKILLKYPGKLLEMFRL